MIKYSQPEFYRFSQSSVQLSEFAFKNKKYTKKVLVYDIFSGSGVVGIEYVLRLKSMIEKVSFVELQFDFKNNLQENIENFIPEIKSEIFIQNFFHLKEINADIILMNPPFYLNKTVREPLDYRRKLANICIGFNFYELEKRLFNISKSNVEIFMLNVSGLNVSFFNLKKTEKLSSKESLYHLSKL